MTDPFVVIVFLILLVCIVQVWSVQRVEYKNKQIIQEMQIARVIIDALTLDVVKQVSMNNTIAVCIRRVENLLVEKGITDKLLTDDLIIDDNGTSDVLPSD